MCADGGGGSDLGLVGVRRWVEGGFPSLGFRLWGMQIPIGFSRRSEFRGFQEFPALLHFSSNPGV